MLSNKLMLLFGFFLGTSLIIVGSILKIYGSNFSVTFLIIGLALCIKIPIYFLIKYRKSIFEFFRK